jgi:hypothetical protein
MADNAPEGMSQRDDIPYSNNLGHGMVSMDIAPDDGCTNCGHWEWAFAIVNTGVRCDLLTNKPIKYYLAKSDCLKCGITTVWNPLPDYPYPQTSDDSFSK